MLPRKFNIFKEAKHLHINNFCLLAECDLVSSYTEGGKALALSPSKQTGVCFLSPNICVCDTLS